MDEEEVDDVEMKLCELHTISADQRDVHRWRESLIPPWKDLLFILFVKGEEEEAVLLVGDMYFVGPTGEERKNSGHKSGSDLTLWEVAQPWEGQRVLLSKV